MRQLVAENSHRRAETAGQTLSERSACKHKYYKPAATRGKHQHENAHLHVTVYRG